MSLKTKVGGAMTVMCLMIAPALAQNPHAGGGAGAGAGAGGTHGPAMGSGNAMGNATGHGNGGSNAPSMGASSKASASSPTTVLDRNSKLDSTLTSKLQSKGLLPAGTDLKDTCGGFKNLGQCIAAIHVSHNLPNVSFDCLKADMTGTAPAKGVTCPAGTGSSKMSLGKSIQTLSPNTDAKTEAKTGQKQAHDDIADAEKNS